MGKVRLESKTLLSGRATNFPLEVLAFGTINVLWGIKHLLLRESLTHLSHACGMISCMWIGLQDISCHYSSTWI